MRLLTFSTLYPNAARPTHGIFVETRLRHLLAAGQVQSTVMAPVPWFPFAQPRFGRYADYARTPREESRHAIRVLHPRYMLLPKIGMSSAPSLMSASLKHAIGKLIDRGGDFDLIDAHYFYPDGVAAVMLGRHFGKPVVITARGTDLNLFPQFLLPRKMIQWAARHAAGIITVCAALKGVLVRLGVPAAHVEVLRNGVDLQTFRPVDRDVERARLGVTGTTLLSVGQLIPLKGHDLTIGALPMLPDARLLIVGHGPEEASLKRLAGALGVAARVSFIGAIPQESLRSYYGAADVLVLASSREGWANVLLEAMACGTPVVASDVGGSPEVVAAPEAGVIMAERSSQGLAQAVRSVLERYPERAATRRYAEQFSWDDTTRGQLDLFQRVLSQRRQA